MASIIRIKRSSGTNKPASLNWGEMGYVTGIGSYGGLNQYKDRVFIGDDGSNVFPVGGHYYTSMMEHTPGVIAGVQNNRNSDNGVVAVLAPADNTALGQQSLKIDQWNVDNLRLDSNTISSTDTDGDIILDPAGSGEVLIPDDTFLTFGDDKDAKIEYDENDTNRLIFSGAQVMFNTPLNVSTESIFGKIKIEDNIISSVSGSGNKLFIDPFPDGLSNEGTVIIKGDLQVDGTTTEVNSTNVTVNDPILNLGDVTSIRTVTAPVASGVSTITVDSVVGINTGDLLAVTGLPNSGVTTVTAYNTSTKVVTFNGTTTAGITTLSQVTVTHAFDTNTDRGVSFQYNTATGTANTKIGFFGYNDSTGEGSSAVARAWTYIPDATITGSVVTGTRGNLDIKGIYYQTGDYSTHGVVFFDSNGLQTSTNDPSTAAATRTSTQILTAVTEVTLTMPSGVTVTAGDQITQVSNSGVQGVVKADSNGTTITLIGVEGTFNTTGDIIRNGTSTGVDPDAVNTVYTNKPMWTNTLDGGTF